ncbi:helicase, putative [Trichomonas vaginalis G3]|uniref:RNA helicase n=1 Tax=Trichomonas vaginalis (strain ATCC PRA-98 / G3) TaxID=412133 RepID=A2DJG9_TRIV3|nr:ATP-dependent RNA helicase family [Trichomonas vaginalis G3]EAY19369.1 helicase, putative [Trichomonas vaginalis G3]KAI5493237.1 ATP-dependent RNA helicase family [Trichomonas vaginalis G3]|eukprot:XP_001580355.1 helicase [Trichomonas vaginalis G3]
MHLENQENNRKNHEINPYENKPYSTEYYRILETRKKLPVYEYKDQILKIVRESNVCIIEGNTGSGKTTQIPQFILESGILNPKQSMICSQPRRVAAINVATRVSAELDCKLGGIVGYNVRFDKCISDQTKLIYMTDGLLLREFLLDPYLRNYGVIIIDEAHERTINTDIILGLLHQALSHRKDLKLIVMSATLEATKFTKFFTINEKIPPHLSIPGRLHPVTIEYETVKVDNYVEKAIEKAIFIHEKEGSGDILIFLTGEDEIEHCCSVLRSKLKPELATGARISEIKVFPLYSSLPLIEQTKVFVPPSESVRKVIVATNIAETSLTIDGIVFVIDSGLVKQTMYVPKRRMSSLQVTNVSRASSIQRSGRAGRTRPGKCFRLYTEKDFNEVLPDQTEPEISRSNLSSVLLLMLAVGIKDIPGFPFIDMPHRHLIRAAIEELHFLGAVDSNCQLTDIGRLMSQFPLEPGLSRALIQAKDFGCNKEVAALVSLLSEQGQVFLRPKKDLERALQMQMQFKNQTSDHITLLTAFEAFTIFKSEKFCNENFLNFRTLESALKSQGQLIEMMQKMNIPVVSASRINPNRNKLILQSLLTGLFTNVAFYDKSGYLFSECLEAAPIHRASCLWGKTPKWVLFSEYVFTDKGYIRTVSEIDESWIVPSSEEYFESSRFKGRPVQQMFANLYQKYAKKQGK